MVRFPRSCCFAIIQNLRSDTGFYPLPRLCGGEGRVRGILHVAGRNPPSPCPLPPQSRGERVKKARTRQAIRWIIVAFALLAVSTTGCEQEPKGGKLQTNSKPPDNTPTEVEVPEPAPTAQEREEALKRLDRGILAHGGAERLGKIKAIVKKMEGFAGPVPEQFPAKQDLNLQFPDRVRNTFFRKTPNEGEIELSLALDGDSGWGKGPQGVTDFGPNSSSVHDLKTEIYLESMAIRLPVKEPGTVVRPLAEVKVNGKLTRGVRVKQDGWPAVNLYFAADSGLLIGLSVQVLEASQSIHRDIYYIGHRPIDGVMLPAVISEYRAGGLFLEWHKIDYQLPDKIDAALLKEPK
jgi:hypothetical protein